MAKQLNKKYKKPPYNPNSELTEIGIQQAKNAGEKVKFLVASEMFPPIEAVFCSPLLRAVQTRDAILNVYPDLGFVDQKEDPRLEEQKYNYEDWEMYFCLHPEKFHAVLHRKCMLRKPSAYTCYYGHFDQNDNQRKARQRIRSFLEEIKATNSVETVLFITHYLTILTLKGVLEETGFGAFLSDYQSQQTKYQTGSVHMWQRGITGRYFQQYPPKPEKKKIFFHG